jgi:polar amino acid transport system permease protein
VALPSLVNSFIGLIKGTSLAFTCAVVEMTAEAKILGGRNYRYFEAYVSLALIYWVITAVIEQIMKRVENRLAIPDEVPEFQYQEDEEEQHDNNSGIIKTIPEKSGVGWD